MNQSHAYSIGDFVKIKEKKRKNIGYIKRTYKNAAKICLSETYDEITLPYSKIEFLPPVVITANELKKIARNNINFFDLFDDDDILGNFKVVDAYNITLEDFRFALTKYKKHICSLDDIKNWFYVLTDELEAAFNTYDIYNINVKNSAYSKNHALCYALSLMCNDLFDEALELINSYYEDINKDSIDKRYPTEYKKDFVRAYDDDNSLKLATDEQITLFHMFANELCKMEDTDGLRAVGYGCYCGNRAFDQDWDVARDCITKLYEKVDMLPDKAIYANTLGYIYYYGRCNNDIPQYEEAYKYFSFGAFNRVYESQYKIADMYKNGYGVVKSVETANNIICKLYEENKKYIVNGEFDCKFADIALRAGNSYRNDEAIEESDFDEMLYYYMQADYAIRMRMNCGDYYGDNRVCASIQEALAKTKELMGFKAQKKTDYYNLAGIFDDTLSFGNKLELKIKPLKNNRYKMTFKTHSKKRMFITIPNLELCGMYEKLDVILKTDDIIKEDLLKKILLIDRIDYNDFMYDDKSVLKLNDYVFEIKAPVKKLEKTYQIASVCFNEGGRLYDYLYEDESIKENDNVNVFVGGEEKVVRVIRISTKKESELSFPVSKYKKL